MSIKSIALIKAELAHNKAASRERFEDLQGQIDRLEKRLEKYDKPAKGAKPKKSDYAALKTRNPVPIPDRPEIMVAAGEGQDPG